MRLPEVNPASPERRGTAIIANTKVDPDERPAPLQRLCRYLSDRSPQPIVAVEGAKHVVIYANPAFTLLTGKGKEDLLGRRFAEAVPEGEENGCVALLDRVFRTGEPENLAEQEHRHAVPGPVYWSYAVWAILGEDERPAGVMVQITDSTETAYFRRQATAVNEALLVSATQQHEIAETAGTRSTRLQSAVMARDHFLAVLSHELRNPLAALSNGLQLFRFVGGDPPRANELMSMMDRQMKQLVRLVDDLLDVSRITTGKLKLRKERVDLASVVREAVEASRPMIERGGHELKIGLPSPPIILDADPTRLAQAFLNLLNNAAKYSEPHGRIQLNAWRDGDEAVISVRDAGIGISAYQLPHIFDVFVQVDASWQRTQGGLGIGLSLVKEFIGLHGGRVEACSDGLGEGSEFVVRLPALADADLVPPSVVAENPQGPPLRILVVDDDRDAAESLAGLLRLMGHDVYVAHGGTAGVAAAAEFRPEVILLDIGMPVVDGYEAARRIRAGAEGAEPFLIALTGWGSEDDRRRTRDAGFDRHLVKPATSDALARVLAGMPVDRSRP